MAEPEKTPDSRPKTLDIKDLKDTHEELLIDLNEEQKAAVTHGEGPLMIVAGAGTGKTTVITRRIAWLIDQKKAKPENILALTFTEKAANEMEERVDRLLPIGYIDMEIATFHGFAERILRRHGLDIGLPPDFSIYTEVDAWLMMRKSLDRFALEYFRPQGNPSKFFRAMLQHFSRAKDEGITPERYLNCVEELISKKSGGAPETFLAMKDEDKLELQRWQELAKAYATYEQLLKENGALDFGGLLMEVHRLFQDRPNILKEYRDLFTYLVVDEFQDTNSIQYKIVKQLAEPKRNITVVGDDDQAIYKFRGAALANILSFRSDFPETKKIVLTNNYRSGKNILEAAYKLIQFNNPHRLEATEGLTKALLSNQTHDGFVHHVHCATLDDEVESVSQEILRLAEKESVPWSEMCVLVRANDAADPFIESLERSGIPYRFVALAGLYTEPIILDALAYLRVVDLPFNSVSAYRLVSHPRLGLNERDLAELMMYVRRKGISILEAMESVTQAIGVSMEGRGRLLELLKIISELRTAAKRLPVTELFVKTLKDTGILGDITVLPEAEQQTAFQHLDAFLSRLRKFVATRDDKSLQAFLEEFDAEREAGEAGALSHTDEEGPDVVQIMTVHAAKGLEFRYVFVVNLVEQRFPSVNRSEALPLPRELVASIPELDDHLAEERRLFYVAMTRAKEGLYLVSAHDYGGTRERKPSRFVTELGFVLPEKPKATSIHVLKQTAVTVPPREMHVPALKTVSFSQIAAFSTCPKQYKYAHILKVPTFGRHQFSFGQSMHHTLQRFTEQILERQRATQGSLFGQASLNPIPSEKELFELFEQNFIDEWYASVAQRDEYQAIGRASLKTLREQFVAATPTIYAVEKGFTLKLGEVVVKGRIDRIDSTADGLEIIDYKTGSPKTRLDWEDKRQLILYAIAVEQCFVGAPAVKKLTYYYLNNNQTVSFEPKETDKEKLREIIIETCEKIMQSDFAPEPDIIKCKYCDFKDICPAARF